MSQRILLVLTTILAVAACAAIDAQAASRSRTQRPVQTASTQPARTQSAITQGAVAVVNDQIISDYDLSQRIALFFVTSGVRPTEENIPMIREQVLRTIEDEILQVKEALAHGVTVSNAEIDQSVAGIAQDNKTTVAEIEATLNRGGVQIGTFRAQLAAQIVWSKVVQGRYGSRLDIREEEVTAAIERIKQGASKPQYRVLEIYLSIDKPEDDARVRASAAQLVEQINKGAPFSAVARQFSQAPSAATGGDIGYVTEGQLAEELDTALRQLRRGQISQPIRSGGGYYILQMRGRLEPAGTPTRAVVAGPPTGPVPLARLLIGIGQNPSAETRQKALAFGLDIQKNVQSCAHLADVGKRTGALYMSLGTIDPKGLSADVQAALAKTEPGGVAPPFFSAAGLEIIARCDPRVDPIESVHIPTPDEMKSQLFQQRAGMLARSYMRDLRRDAVIETR